MIDIELKMPTDKEFSDINSHYSSRYYYFGTSVVFTQNRISIIFLYTQKRKPIGVSSGEVNTTRTSLEQLGTTRVT